MWTLLYGALAFAQALSFTQALERAPESPLVTAPERAHTARKTEASGMSRLTDNPVVQVQPGTRSLYGRGGQQGFEVYLSAWQRFRLTGYGEKRKASVQRELGADEANYGLALRQARHAIAQAWLGRWASQEVVATADSEAALATELLERIQVTLAAGEATRVDVALIETWRAEAALLRLSAEGQRFDNGIELARSMGAETDLPLVVTSELPEVDVPSETALRASLGQLDKAPSVLAARANRDADAARLVEARAARGTELALGGMGWREGGGDIAGVGIIELVLPTFEKGKRESSAAAAALAQARELERQAHLDTRAERLRIIHEVVHTEEVLRATEDSLLKAAENLAEAQRKRLEAREGTAQDWVIARRAVLRARIDAVQARAAYILARFRAHEALSPVATTRSQ
jgi:cobalt-zinc-cadmium efflux system outer membrane protein